jgi:hypothetical protein
MPVLTCIFHSLVGRSCCFALIQGGAAATVSKMETVQIEGGHQTSREIEFYNLDAVIAVGYRVNSIKATHFRIWATNTLREYIVKGFVLNDELLKNGLFGVPFARLVTPHCLLLRFA